MITWQSAIFHNYLSRYQWPLKPQGLEFAINNCSRSSTAVTQNKSQLVDVMNEVWCSDAFAPKFVLKKGV